MNSSAPTIQVGQEASQAIMRLPDDVTAALTNAYKVYTQAVKRRTSNKDDATRTLASIAVAGRQAGWPIRALAEPCGVTPERLRQLISANCDTAPADVTFPPYTTARPAAPRTQSRRKHLTEEEAAQLRQLAPIAKLNSGSRPLESEIRDASEQFSALIIHHHDEGVTWRELSDATRTWTSWPLTAEQSQAIKKAAFARKRDPFPPTHRADSLRMRAARHGYGKGAPPSMKPYLRVSIHDRKNEAD